MKRQTHRYAEPQFNTDFNWFPLASLDKNHLIKTSLIQDFRQYYALLAHSPFRAFILSI
jgi:hypothetical protein